MRSKRLRLSAVLAVLVELSSLAFTGGNAQAAATFSANTITPNAGDCKTIVNGKAFVGGTTAALHTFNGSGWNTQNLAPAAVEYTTDCETADLNGDGSQDVVVPDGGFSGGSIVAFMGGITKTALIGSAGYRHDLEVADFNGDGAKDIAAGREGDLRAWWGPGFTTSTLVSTAGGEGLASGDLNGDGRADLIKGGTIHFGPLTGSTQSVHGSTWGTGVVGDFNGDGSADLVTAPMEATGSEIALYAGPTFATKTVIDTPGADMHGIETADFNGDGAPDLATGKMGGALVVYERAIGGWTKATISATQKTHNVAVGDLNGDGRADILAGGYIGFGPTVAYFSTTTTTTTAPTTTTTTAPTTTTTTTTAATTTTTTAATSFGSVRAVEDATIRAGSGANVVDDTSTIRARLSNTPPDGNTREALIKFNISGFGSQIDQAALTIRGRSSSPSGVSMLVLRANSTWAESSVTWYTSPALRPGVVGFSTNATSYSTIIVDVTPLVRSAKRDGESFVTLKIVGQMVGTSVFTAYSSEQADLNRRPTLFVSHRA